MKLLVVSICYYFRSVSLLDLLLVRSDRCSADNPFEFQNMSFVKKLASDFSRHCTVLIISDPSFTSIPCLVEKLKTNFVGMRQKSENLKIQRLDSHQFLGFKFSNCGSVD